jgi:hypothetical protein
VLALHTDKAGRRTGQHEARTCLHRLPPKTMLPGIVPRS